MTGEYSPIVVADLTLMAQQAAPLWGFSPESRVTLTSLSENATFRLHDPAQQRSLSLRLHRVGYHTDAEISAELAWIDALRQDDVIPTPQPLQARNGQRIQLLPSPAGFEPRRAVAFDFVYGQTPDPDEHELTPWFAALGALTAKMHLHSQSWRRPASFSRKLWSMDAMVGQVAYWGPWRGALGLSPHDAPMIERAIAAIAAHLHPYGTGQDRFGLVHADLRLANLLVENDTLHVIDFDDCGLSWFLYDFAAAISFHEQHPAVPQWQAAWIDGYQQHRRLSREDLAVLPALIMLRRILLTAWLGSHSEIPLAQHLGSQYTQGTLALAEEFLSRHD